MRLGGPNICYMDSKNSGTPEPTYRHLNNILSGWVAQGPYNNSFTYLKCHRTLPPFINCIVIIFLRSFTATWAIFPESFSTDTQ